MKRFLNVPKQTRKKEMWNEIKARRKVETHKKEEDS
jgi:hypothetical protein